MIRTMDADVIVVGAGLTGLSAACELSRAGLSVLVFEKSDHVGGRMSTHEVGGFKLDHGFQVLLTAYPEVKKLDGLAKLAGRSFSSGARIRTKGRFVDFCDPLRHPDHLFSTLFSPLARVTDLVRLFAVTRGTRALCEERGISTLEGLRASGFSENFQEGFLRPFLRGVLLDPNLRVDYGLASFYLQMFAKGEALLPEGGIQALPNLLADRIGRSHIRLNTAVNGISSHEITLENGDTFGAQQVICAVDTMAATQLGSPEQAMHHLSTATLYFSAPEAPFPEPLVVVSAEDGPITTLAVLTNVQPSYAPPGRTLIAISSIGEHANLPEVTLCELVLAQAKQWYGDSVSSWSLLRRILIPAGVVCRPRMTKGYMERSGVLFAGDYLSYPSQNGALAAGRAVAHHVLERLS
jgi:phytoene dehydrogenase-like protein